MNSSVVKGLCATKQWKRAIDIVNFEDMHSSKQILVQKMFDERDIDSAWRLLNEPNMIVESRNLLSYWDYCEEQKATLKENIEKMLSLIERKQCLINETAVLKLLDLLNQSGYKSTVTTISSYVHFPKSNK